jgi:hypothetical protein
MSDTLDPNWFYSSLAQSAASVVGLLGGLLATRLQSDLERAEEQRVRTSTALQKLYGKVRPFTEQLRLYARHCAPQIEEVRDALKAKTTNLRPQIWYSPFDTGLPDRDVTVDQHIIDVESARLRLTEALLPLLEKVLTARNAPALTDFSVRTQPLLSSIPAEGMTELVERIVNLASNGASELGLLRIRASSTLTRGLWRILGVLAVGGLIVPLGFLAAYRAIDRIALLALFSGGIGCLLWYIRSRVVALEKLGCYQSLLPPRDGTL